MTAAATAEECERALAEFRAQRQLLDSARSTTQRLRSDQLAGAYPAVWSTTTAGAYTDRLDALAASLEAAISVLDEACGRVDAAIADVIADIPVALAAGENLR